MKYLIKSVKIILLGILICGIGILLIFGHRDISLNVLKAKYTTSASSFISVNGMDVHFRDEGNPADSIPIILIHGTASSLHTFDTWTHHLKTSHRVIRIDLPAYGLTGPFPNRDYSMLHYTTFLKDFLRALGIKKCVLAGNSFGGRIAWNYALAEPNMVTKLILIDAAGYPMNSKSVPIAFKMAHIPVAKNILTYVTPRFIVRSSIENVFYDKSKVTDVLIDRYFELTLRAGNRHAFVDRLNSPKDTTACANISSIQQPTLILWGMNDLLIPVNNAYRFHEDLPNNTLVILDNTGHTPMEESPLRSLAPVLDFLNESK